MTGGSRSRAGYAGAAAFLIGSACCAYGATTAVAGHAGGKPTAPANAVANGDFALPASAFSNGLVGYLSPQGYAVNKLPVKRIPGWTILEGSTNGTPNPNAGGVVVFQKARLQAPQGTAQSLELSNNGPGSISDTIKTTPGATYILTWYGAGYPDGKSVKLINVSWDASQIATASFKGKTGANMGWTLHHEDVTATGTSSTLEFSDGTSPTDPYGPFVGDVSLTKQGR